VENVPVTHVAGQVEPPSIGATPQARQHLSPLAHWSCCMSHELPEASVPRTH